ncbi:rRNA pseudouridine synthase [Dissulfurirhabdus thermomarina]|uniref:rRNA pseudouridine synthase n=1 Tax=Dissulfurirhabdus thermomarina TaxID=1765737 RepID=A0A6N9TUV5_DISTH|nr:pseudouridine synthase [Dissulfurirhabdus thermomarina]NDY43514.1 rRNA pseudouridine synthase [Dissulfurirhabdus thermomarina]NMX24486.1 rRNA pseudouridine synthase [Dissulfurirhabdus thermomarina]
MEPVRLQKYLADAGVASRRAAEELIRQGRVAVDGVAVTTLGTRVIPGAQSVTVDGRPVAPGPAPVYILLHKPRGVLTTLRDPFGRPTVRGLLRGVKARVFPVGRLDLDSEGLLLCTNDGALAHRLLHPRFKVDKTYLVTVRGRPSRDDLGRLAAGVEIEGGRTLPCRVRRVGGTRRASVLEVILKEGRKRQIRLMCEAVGHPVTRLVRVAMGPLALGDLPPGAWRPLEPAEVAALRAAAGLAGAETG